MGDMVVQTPPAHCHMIPGHPTPGGPVPMPVPPAPPLKLMVNTSVNVMVGGQPFVTQLTMTTPCILPACTPAGPGQVQLGSMTVKVNMKAAGRMGDMTQHSTCVGPVPAPVGKIMGPGAPTVMVGG